MTQVCFWTSLAKAEQACGQPELISAYTFDLDSGATTQLAVSDVGIVVPTFAAPTTVNLLDLPGASYTIATTNPCGDAISLSVSGGVLATPSAQPAGACPAVYDGVLAVTITAPTFPFPAGAEALYGGRLLGTSYGYGVEGSGSDSVVSIGLAAETPNYSSPLGFVSYFSMTPDTVYSNAGSGVADGIAAAITGGGLYVHVVAIDPGSTFDFSTDLQLHIPPPQPQRFYAIVEEAWPTASDPGGTTFPASPGVVDGVTTIPIKCAARDLTYDDMTPAVDTSHVLLAHGLTGAAAIDMTHIYKLGIYAGDEGYTNMARTATLKLVPSAGGGL